MREKKQRKSFHLTIDEDVINTVKTYISQRPRETMTGLMTKALLSFFNQESPNPDKERALKAVLDMKFIIPTGYTLRSFWLTLHMLKEKYPNDSSKNFWGEMVYISSIDKTNKEIFIEISEEVKTLMTHGKKEKA